MARPTPLPLPIGELPDAIRKFCDPAAPGPARLMAARGLVPLKGASQLLLLLQLAADQDGAIARSAGDALDKMPPAVLLPSCGEPMADPFLDALCERFVDRDDVLGVLVAHRSFPLGTLEWLAFRCSEPISERIAVNEQLLLAAPKVIEALYKNKQTRMSTADRLIELCVRNGVTLELPVFAAHVEAIRGQLVVDAGEEALPSDLDFAQALADDDDNPEAVSPAQDEDAAEDEVKKQYLPLMMRIRQMTGAEKLRLAMVGNAAARAFLVRDRDKAVAFAAISSPSMRESDAVPIASSKEVSEEVLRYIGNKRDWTKNHEIKRGLVFNPKSPVGISLRFVGHLRDDELRSLARSRNVAQPLKSAALQRIMVKEKKEKGGP
jgi:hypothetical protein